MRHTTVASNIYPADSFALSQTGSLYACFAAAGRSALQKLLAGATGTSLIEDIRSGIMNPCIVASLFFALASSSAYAGLAAIPVPEPEILELLAVAAVAMIVVGVRQRHKK